MPRLPGRLGNDPPQALVDRTGSFRAFIGFVPAAGVGAVALVNDLRGVDRVGLELLTELST